jgi:hypothetical protein
MSSRRREAVSVVAVGALLIGGLAAASPAQAVTGYTYLVMDGDAGDYVTGGAAYSFTEANATFTPNLTASTANFFVLQGAYVQYWTVDLRAPEGEDFVAGTTYTDAQRAPFATAPHPGLDVYGDSRGCNTVTGSFTVLEIEKDAGTGEVTRFAATFENHCEGAGPANRGTIAYNATKSPATITSTTPPTARVNGPVTVSGTLADAAGPLAGAAITVSRPDGSGGTTSFPATTGVDGTWSVNDTIGTAVRTYTVEYAGDASHYAATTSISVAAVKAASILALRAPTTVARGHSYTLTGTLTSGGVAVPSATVTVTRTGLSGKRTLYVKTSSTGRFSYKDVPTVGGPVAWTASWAGDADRSSVTAKRSVTVSRASTSVTITSDKSVYAYGGRAVVKVHLGTTYNNRAVAIYARKLNGGAARMVKAGKVNASGNLVVSLPVTVKTIYSVKFAGDYRYLPVGKARTVNVRAKVTVKMGGAYGRSGSGYLFRAGTNPAISVQVTPARPGGCVDLVAQRLNGSTWQTTSTLACATLDFSSQAFATLFTNGGVGRGRMMASTGAGAFSSSGSSGWIYYTFT